MYEGFQQVDYSRASLGKFLGSGANSRVYELIEHPDVAAKVANSVNDISGEKGVYERLSVLPNTARPVGILYPLQVVKNIAFFPKMTGDISRFRSEGTPLSSLTPFSREDFENLVRTLASGIDVLHKIGVTHNDIDLLKLENVLFRTVGTKTEFFLADFGHAGFHSAAVGAKETKMDRVQFASMVEDLLTMNTKEPLRFEDDGIRVAIVNTYGEMLGNRILEATRKLRNGDYANLTMFCDDLFANW